MREFPVEDTPNVRDPADFLDHVWSVYDGKDLGAATSLVQAFREVANNRSALISKLHAQLRGVAGSKFAQYKQSSILLEGARSKRPYLRANIWPLISPDSANYADFCKAYSYYFPHSHNFSFLTTSYFGPGYRTEVWGLNADPCGLEVGCKIGLEYQGAFKLTNSNVMLYEANKDVHVQYPPPSLSISLNLMLYREADKYTTQYFVDTASSRVVGTSSQSPGYRRLTLIRMAELIGNEETLSLLDEIAAKTVYTDLQRAASTAASRMRCMDYQSAGGPRT